MSATQARGVTGVVIAAVLFGLALLGGGVATYLAVRETSDTLVRGQAEMLHGELRLAVGRGLPTRDELAQILAETPREELRLEGLAIADGAGEILVEAGDAVHGWGPLPTGRPGPLSVSLERRGGRARATYRRGLRPRLAERLGLPPAAQLSFVFQPRAALVLERRAAWGLGLSTLFAIFAVVIALRYEAQRRRAVEALRKEEQSRRLAALGQMSAVIAHELRNPLASLKGHAQLLERALPEGDRLRDKAALVVGEALRLEQLSGDLLTFVRSGELHPSMTDLVALAKDVAAAQPERVRVEGEVAPISVDGARLRQVLVNLVENARQAGEGPIEISLREERGAVLSVRDHGPGLAPEAKARLFEPFFTTRTRGTGLGLSIARHVVELHGGRIEGGDAEGGGARFTVWLPRRAS